jgi:hypothetical protein
VCFSLLNFHYILVKSGTPFTIKDTEFLKIDGRECVALLSKDIFKIHRGKLKGTEIIIRCREV